MSHNSYLDDPFLQNKFPETTKAIISDRFS
jgi:hypothetical protein